MLVALAPSVNAQINSNIAGVTLGAVLNTSLSLFAAPGTVNFGLVPNGVANGDTPITITTSWSLRPNVGALTIYAYFSAPAAALTNGAGTNIASSRVLGSPNGAAFVPFTGASPFSAAGSLTVATFRILGNNRNGTRLDTLSLQIDTTGLALAAGAYNGVLNIQAQAL